MSDQTQPGGDRPPEITFSDLGRVLWRALREMRTVLYLLMVIAAACLVGTIIPQGDAPEAYTDSYGPALGTLVVRLGLHQVFHTSWFMVLVAILMLSLIACTRRLWAQAAEKCRVPDAERASRRFKAAKAPVEGSASVPPSEAAGLLTIAARRRGYVAHALGEADGSQWVHLAKRRWSAWGTVVTHYAIFLVAVGALLGSVPGLSVDAYIPVAEGEVAEGAEHGLPFDIRLGDFRIDESPETGSIQQYYSDIALLEDGGELASQTISVNRPLRYRHFYVSQSSWGLSAARLKVEVAGQTAELEFPLERGHDHGGGMTFWQFAEGAAAAYLPGEEAAIVATDFYADAERDGDEVRGRFSETAGTPAISLTMVSGFKGGEHKMEELGWLFPGERVKFEGGEAEFVGVAEWSGLGVRKDLGVPLVWIGFIASLIGLMMSFYFPADRATVRLQGSGEAATEVGIAYTRRPGFSDDAAGEIWASVLKDIGAREKAQSSGTMGEVMGND